MAKCGRYTRRAKICVVCNKKEYVKKPENIAKTKNYQKKYQKKENET